jgi:hypothetical protein
MKYVLDANVALKWVLPEPDSPKAKQLPLYIDSNWCTTRSSRNVKLVSNAEGYPA